MSKQRYINTKFWSDSFIVDLNPLDRYLFLYLLTNEHTNIAGIYELPITRMAQETGIDKEMIPKMLRRMNNKVRHIKGWIIIKNFQKHQQNGEKIHLGITNIMAELPLEIREYYTNWQSKKDRVSIGLDRVSIDLELSKSNLNSNLIKSNKERGRFTPPTLSEVSSYCLERKNKVDPQRFIDFYEAKGWMIGKNKMKSWKAAVRTWEGRESEVVPNTNPIFNTLVIKQHDKNT